MNELDRVKRLQQFIGEELLFAEEAVGIDVDLLSTGLVDSLGIIRLLGFMEDELGIAVPPEDVTLDNFLSVSTIENYLAGRGE
jgi:acyl carrier protein